MNDWGETSADQAIALTEYFLTRCNIDPEKVYLHGYSGGETGSLVMAKRPGFYTAFLCCATKWDGDMAALVNARTRRKHHGLAVQSALRREAQILEENDDIDMLPASARNAGSLC